MLKKLEAANVESRALLEMLRRTKLDLASRDTREAARYVRNLSFSKSPDRCHQTNARQGNGKESVSRVDRCLRCGTR